METKTNIIEKNKVKLEKPKNYKVIMHNDDHTSMDFVVYILTDIFNKNIDDANKIMLDVHQKGIGIAGVYSFDIATTKVSIAMSIAEEEGFPFKLTIEEE